MPAAASAAPGLLSGQSGAHDSEAPDLLSVIDLADVEFKVVQTIKLPNPKMALMHPDGRHLLVPYATGIQVFEMRHRPAGAGQRQLDRSPSRQHRHHAKGDRIASQGTTKGGKGGRSTFAATGMESSSTRAR